MKGSKIVLYIYSCVILFWINLTQIAGLECPPIQCNQTRSNVGNWNSEAGRQYLYDIESLVSIQLAGTEANLEQSKDIKFTGQVKVIALTACEFYATLQQANIISPDGKKQNVYSDLGGSIRFALDQHDRIIEGSICGEKTDSEFQLNIKRGIISMLQSNDGSNYIETDLFGQCPTQVSRTTMSDKTIVTRQRNLNDCSYREIYAGGMFTSYINANAGVKTTHMLSSHYMSEQHFSLGTLKFAKVNENYSFLPFSSSSTNGVKSHVVTQINLIKTEHGKTPATLKNQVQVSIFYNVPINHQNKNMPKMKAKITEIIKMHSISNIIQPKTGGLFIELINLMRNAPKDDLLSLYGQTRTGLFGNNVDVAKRIYYDALFRTGTSESAEAILTLINQREIQLAFEIRLAYLSFNLVQSVTDNTIKAALKLLDGTPINEAYIAIGSLVKTYCQQPKQKCESNKIIKEIMEKFVKKLDNCKAVNKLQEDVVLSILHGLRNSKNLQSPALEKVILCANEKHTTRIRVNAIKIFRENACNKKIQQSALTLLKKIEEDSELRIEAYLGLIECPTTELALELTSLLNSEPVNQVGSFITSHLETIKLSTDPSRLAQRNILATITTTKQFPIHCGRFSCAREVSYAMDNFGIGGSTSATVVYSQNHLLPKSARLNVTGEIFGQYFNVLQIDLRQDNIDHIVEHYIGPQGILSTKSRQELFDYFMEHLNMGNDLYDNLKRTKRSSPREDSATFAKSVQLLKNNEIFSNGEYDNINLDFTVNIFGSELYFLSFSSSNAQLKPNELLMKFFNEWKNFNTHIKEFNHKFNRYALFMDVEFSYPTSIGFPLKLTSQGTAVIQTEFGGSVDVTKLLSASNDDTIIKIKFAPNINLVLVGQMSCDGWTVSTGLQIQGSFFTSTNLDLDYKYKATKDIFEWNIKINSPTKRLDLFHFESSISYVTKERGGETVQSDIQFGEKQKKLQTMDLCTDRLDQLIGVKFCFSSQYRTPIASSDKSTVKHTALILPNDNLAFPLNGNTKIGVWLELEPVYEYSFTLNKSKYPKELILDFQFNTPTSATKRKSRMTITLNQHPNMFIRSDYDILHNKGYVILGLQINDKDIGLFFDAKLNDQFYKGRLGLEKINSYGTKKEYKPVLFFKTPKQEINTIYGYEIIGLLILDQGNELIKIEFKDLNAIHNNIPLNYILNGYMNIGLKDKSIETNIKLGIPNGKSTNLLSKFAWQMNEKSKGFSIDIGLKSDVYYLANGRTLFAIETGKNNQKFHSIIVMGNDFNSNKNRFELMHNLEFRDENRKSMDVAKYEGILHLPFIPIIIKSNFQYESNLLKFEGDFNIDKTVLKTEGEIKINGIQSGDYDAKVIGSLNQHQATFTSKREILNIKGIRKSTITSKLTSNFGVGADVYLKFNHKLDYREADIEIDSLFTIEEKGNPFIVKGIVKVDLKKGEFSCKCFHGNKNLINISAKCVFNSETNGDQYKFSNIDTGQITIDLHEILVIRGEKKTTKNGGIITFNGEMKKISGRKFLTELSYVYMNQIYELQSKIYYDHEKDSKKLITIGSKNIISENKIESDNKLNINGDDYTIHFVTNKKIEHTFNKQYQVDLIVKTPKGRYIVLNAARELKQLSNDKYLALITVNGTEQHNKKERKLQIYNKFIGGINKAGVLDFIDDTDIAYIINLTGFDDNEYKTAANINFTPNNDRKDSGSKFLLKWQFETNPSGKITEVIMNLNNVRMQSGEGSLNIKCDKTDCMQITGNYNINNFGSLKPSNYDVSIWIPQKKIKIITNGNLQIQPKQTNGLNELNWRLYSNFDGVETKFDINGNCNENHGAINFNLILHDRKPVRTDFSYTLISGTSLKYGNIISDLIFRPKQLNTIFNINYEEQKFIKIEANYEHHTDFIHDLTINIMTSFDDYKKMNLQILTKHPTNIAFDVIIICELPTDRIYKMKILSNLSQYNPSVQVLITRPNQPDIEFLIDIHESKSQISGNNFKAQIKLNNVYKYNMDMKIAGAIEARNKYEITSEINIPFLKAHDLSLKLSSPSIGSGIDFEIKEKDNNIASGTIDYIIKENNAGKFIIEGDAIVKIYDDKNHNGHFELKREIINISGKPDNGVFLELGQSLTFELQLDDRSINGEYTVTNKRHINNLNICITKLKCGKIQIQTLSDNEKFPLNYQINGIYQVDLQPLGIEVNIASELVLINKENQFENKFNAQILLDNQKMYKYDMNLDDVRTQVNLRLGRERHIQAIMSYQLPIINRKKPSIFGKYNIGFTGYVNKIKNPSKIAKAIIHGEIDHTNYKQWIANFIIEFNHVGLERPLLINCTNKLTPHKLEMFTEIDIFKELNNKLIFTTSLNNKNLQWNLKNCDVSGEIAFFTYDKRLLNFNGQFHTILNFDEKKYSEKILLTGINGQFINYVFNSENHKIESILSMAETEVLKFQSTNMDGNVELILSVTSIVSKKNMLYININANSFKAIAIKFEAPSVSGIGILDLQEKIELKIKGYNDVDMFNGYVMLKNDEILQSHYEINESNLNITQTKMLNILKMEIDENTLFIKSKLENALQNFDKNYSQLKTAGGNINFLFTDFGIEINKIINEILDEPQLKQLNDDCMRFIMAITKIFGEFCEIMKTYFNTFTILITEYSNILINSFGPLLQNLLNKLIDVALIILEEFWKNFQLISKIILNILKEFEVDIRELLKWCGENFRQSYLFFNKLTQKISKELVDIYQLILNQLKAMSQLDEMVSNIMIYIKNSNIDKTLRNIFSEVFTFIKNMLPKNYPITEFIKATGDYIDNKFDREKNVNDIKELRLLYDLLLKSIISIIELARTELGGFSKFIYGDIHSGAYVSSQVATLLGLESNLKLQSIETSSDIMSSIRQLSYLKLLSFSPIYDIHTDMVSNLYNFIREIIPVGGISDRGTWIAPYDLYGQIISGRHIITFDGFHFTFKGKECNYVLAQDIENGNITILLQYTSDGEFKSLHFIDKKHHIEVEQNIVKYNEKPSELPIHIDSIHVWKTWHSITILSEYGFEVICSNDINICQIKINGFYGNKIRGLMGNGNNEPFDDTMLPNMKISSDIGEFGNAYRLQKTCALINTATSRNHVYMKGNATKNRICADLFSSTSLSLCNWLVDNKIYHETCENAVEAVSDYESKTVEACKIVIGYVNRCHLSNIFIPIPNQCWKCSTEQSKENYQVSLPNKKADIIILAELSITEAVLNEIISAFTIDMRTQLKARGLSDIIVNVVGYDDNKQYLMHFTSIGGGLDYNSKFHLNLAKVTNIPNYEPALKTGIKRLDELFEIIDKGQKYLRSDYGLSSDANAFRYALSYPYRSEAERTIIAIRNSSLTYSSNPIKLVNAAIASKIAENLGINVHLITPLKLEGKNAKQVIGFNKRVAIQMSDGKKRTNIGSTDVRGQLKYNTDLGIEHTDGYIVSLDNYVQYKIASKERKQFLTILLNAIADQMARNEYDFDCKCILTHQNLWPQDVCTVKKFNFGPPIKKITPSRG